MKKNKKQSNITNKSNNQITDCNSKSVSNKSNNKVTDKEVLNNIINDYSTLLQKVTDLKSLAEEQNLYSTSTLMDDLISSYTKHLWMLKQMSE